MTIRHKIGSLCWILCAQYLVAEWLTSLAWKIPYSYVSNYISDLGAIGCDESICSPLHALMNGSFALQGILIGAGAVLIGSDSESSFSWLRFLGKGLLSISGIGVLFVGIYPEDTNGSIHATAAAAHFLGAGLAICLFGFWRLRTRQDKGQSWRSIVVGIAILAATLLLSERHSGWPIFEYTGVIERIASYGITLWLIAAGVRSLRRAEPSPWFWR